MSQTKTYHRIDPNLDKTQRMASTTVIKRRTERTFQHLYTEHSESIIWRINLLNQIVLSQNKGTTTHVLQAKALNTGEHANFH